MRRTFFLIPILVLILAACSLPARSTPTPPAELLATVVAATMQAIIPTATPVPSATFTPAPTWTPAPTSTPVTGRVNGKACYQDKGLPEIVLYFENVMKAQVFQTSVKSPKEVYSIELFAGTYKVYGWTPDFTVGVMVAGHETIEVPAGSLLPGVDFCDFSRGPVNIPYPPDFSPSKARGSISGNITGYGGYSQLTVVAFNQATGYWYYVILMPGVTTFIITDLPAGRYQVVVYDPLGTTGGTQPDVYVIAGKETKLELNQWSGGYPSNPVK